MSTLKNKVVRLIGMWNAEELLPKVKQVHLSYEFSWYEQVKTPYLEKRKWWNIFGSDTLAYNISWVIKRHTITSPELVEMFICNSGIIISELNNLIFVDKIVCNKCLTQGARAKT